MSLSVGIVGLPNVGKSTLFNALLKKQIALSANYPFATIDPNIGVVEIIDERLFTLASIVKTQIIKHPTIKFIDIAGLVKGASQGEGLGNQFLAHIRETDLICHCLRGFSDSSIIREGSIDPKTDLETTRTELQLADLATLDKQILKKGKLTDGEKKRWQLFETFKDYLNKGMNLNQLVFKSEEERILNFNLTKELNLLTSKPEIFVVNVADNGLTQDVGVLAKALGLNFKRVVLISAKFESDLSLLDEEDQKELLNSLDLKENGLNRLAGVAYKALNLQSFLTAGEKEVKAWTIRKGMKAPQAAGVIHSDFEKHFIKAKIISFDDFVMTDGWKGAKEKGKIRLEGKNYVMRVGDIVEFVVNC